MTATTTPAHYVPLDLTGSMWDEFSTVAPLVLVGTIEADGSPDIAPKHQAMPLGHGTLFGFVCRDDHATYRNAVATESFSVGYPSAEMVLQTSLAAAPRDSDGAKPTLEVLSLSPATVIDGVLVDGCPVQLECRLERIVDDLGASALLVGRVVAAYATQKAMADRVPLLAYVHPGRVAAVHETKGFPYHRGFHR
jgi:flavin reductase (DIM6/NTAB) family NADH-FMN oxidoreductase RutF